MYVIRQSTFLGVIRRGHFLCIKKRCHFVCYKVESVLRFRWLSDFVCVIRDTF